MQLIRQMNDRNIFKTSLCFAISPNQTVITAISHIDMGRSREHYYPKHGHELMKLKSSTIQLT
ncbi:hypothetical protein [Paraglaciecola sp. L3A3]|uniref:hypothetical protein n=1 Tax=Paraglaciecola sp. L3A3 TaxID=2686358 RepID=UPI00131AA9CA|nr:hypothetical protein [Paraglaciecola sp. L3A3]